MKPVWECLDTLAQLLRERQLLLSLDFDGTLVERSRTPRCVSVPASVRRGIAAISRRAGTHVVLNSGRDIQELRRLIQIDRIGYAGNHGLEIQVDDMQAQYRNPQWRDTLDALMMPLQELALENPELMVHDKGLTIAVYVGALQPERRKIVELACRALLVDVPGGKVTPGVDMMNIRPDVLSNKATALHEIYDWLQARIPAPRIFAIHIGDDASDDEVFASIDSRNGCGIQVGRDGMKTSHASYLLRDTAEVERFLQWLSEHP